MINPNSAGCGARGYVIVNDIEGLVGDGDDDWIICSHVTRM